RECYLAFLAISTTSVFAFALLFFFLVLRPPPTSTLFPYTTLFRSKLQASRRRTGSRRDVVRLRRPRPLRRGTRGPQAVGKNPQRSEEHTSELQSLAYLVCRLLLEKKKEKTAVNDEHGKDACRLHVK